MMFLARPLIKSKSEVVLDARRSGDGGGCNVLNARFG